MKVATKFCFAVGIGHFTKVTVKASCYERAVERAFVEMDRRFERQNREPPLGWDLYLLWAK